MFVWNDVSTTDKREILIGSPIYVYQFKQDAASLDRITPEAS